MPVAVPASMLSVTQGVAHGQEGQQGQGATVELSLGGVEKAWGPLLARLWPPLHRLACDNGLQVKRNKLISLSLSVSLSWLQLIL